MHRALSTFVDRMGHAAESDGLSPIAGRLFATLLLSDQPRSLDELADELGVSKASVSTEARRLFERGIVERVSRPGDRRDYYDLPPDFFAQVIRSRMAQWRRAHDLARTLRDGAPGLAPLVRDRLASMDDIYSFVVDGVDRALVEWEQRSRSQVRDAKPAPRRRTTA